MPQTVLVQGRKLDCYLLTAASQAADPSKLFYVANDFTQCRFLVDTGAAVSIVPATAADRRLRMAKAQSFVAAYGSSISSYGRRDLSVSFNRRQYRWSFAVADIKFCILGSDFLQHHNLLVDVSSRPLLPADCVHLPEVTAIAAAVLSQSSRFYGPPHAKV